MVKWFWIIVSVVSIREVMKMSRLSIEKSYRTSNLGMA